MTERHKLKKSTERDQSAIEETKSVIRVWVHTCHFISLSIWALTLDTEGYFSHCVRHPSRLRADWPVCIIMIQFKGKWTKCFYQCVFYSGDSLYLFISISRPRRALSVAWIRAGSNFRDVRLWIVFVRSDTCDVALNPGWNIRLISSLFNDCGVHTSR